MLYGHIFLINESYYIEDKKCKNLLEKSFIDGIIQEGLYCFESDCIFKEKDIDEYNQFMNHIKISIRLLRESKINIKKRECKLAKQRLLEVTTSLNESVRELNKISNDIKSIISNDVIACIKILVNMFVLYVGTIYNLKVTNSVIEGVGGNLNIIQPVTCDCCIDFKSITETKTGKDLGKCICMIKDLEKDHEDILTTYIQISSIIRLLKEDINELLEIFEENINKDMEGDQCNNVIW